MNDVQVYFSGSLQNCSPVIISCENKITSKVCVLCVWIDPTADLQASAYQSTHTFVDLGRNTVAMLSALIGYLVHFDGQLDPC